MEQLIQELQLDPAAADSEAMDKAGDLLREKEFRGILLTAPPELDLEKSTGIPIAGFDAHLTTERGGVDFQYSAILVATDLKSGETFSGTLHKVHEEDGPPIASEPPISADVMNSFTTDARSRIEGLPWQPGPLSLVILLADQCSNQVRIDRKGGANPNEGTTAAESSIEIKASKASPDQEFPKLPPAEGISLAVGSPVTFKEGEKCVLKGAFRLPTHLLKNHQLSISLIVTGDQMVGAVTLPLKITIEKPDQSSSTVTGRFELDLFALTEMPKTPQHYRLWAFSHEFMSPPASVVFETR